MSVRRVSRWAIIAIAALAVSGCTAPGAPRRTATRPVVTVASFDFPESVLLAELYGQALQARAFPAAVVSNAGPRELVEPALARGLVDVVPEYEGSALAFLTTSSGTVGGSSNDVLQSLAAAYRGHGVVPLRPAPAEDANAIVVTSATAARYRLASISDLIAVAPRLVFGGPPECPTRPLCLLGLERVYGLRFRQFVALDTGGPLTVTALRAGDIDVALLFTSDPAIVRDRLVVLRDDLGLEPPENVLPVVRASVLRKYGASFAAAVDAVSSALTTNDLVVLNAQVAGDPGRAATVASRWLATHGLTGASG